MGKRASTSTISTSAERELMAYDGHLSFLAYLLGHGPEVRPMMNDKESIR